MQRGNNRQPCFFCDADRLRYLADLQEACRTEGVAVHAYALMDNHVHLLATPQARGGLGRAMQILGRKYVAFVNRRHARTGSLWEGRFKACLVDTDSYLWTCHRYIELNPVRAGLCGHPSEYRWSSFGFNARALIDSMVTPRPEYLALGGTHRERSAAYAQLFGEDLSDAELRVVRNVLQQQKALGSRLFQAHAGRELGRMLSLRARGRPKRTGAADAS